MTGPEDMIVPMLREMRAENATLHQQTLDMMAALEKKVRELEGHK